MEPSSFDDTASLKLQATDAKRKAEDISAVLYPNDATEYGRELRLKQQIFFVSAAIQVAVRICAGFCLCVCCVNPVSCIMMAKLSFGNLWRQTFANGNVITAGFPKKCLIVARACPLW